MELEESLMKNIYRIVDTSPYMVIGSNNKLRHTVHPVDTSSDGGGEVVIDLYNYQGLKTINVYVNKDGKIALYEQKIIKKSIFAVYRNQSLQETSKLYLGEIPKEYNKDTAQCEIIDKDNTARSYKLLWACKMSHIVYVTNTIELFKNESNITNITAIFDTGTNLIILPKDFYEIVYRKVMDKIECLEMGGKFISLLCLDINNFTTLGFVFDGYDLTFDSSDLFQAHLLPDGEYIYNFRILFAENANYALFGMPFFEKYFTIFDSESKKMKFTNYPNSNNSIIKVK